MKRLESYAGVRFRIICVIAFALIPYHPISAFTATKDTIFAGFFFLIVLKTFLLVGRQEQFFSSVKEMALYCLFVFLMCAFRNTGIYIFVFSFPAMLVVWRKYWKKMLAVGITCILAWGIYVGPVYGVLHIGKGSSAEMLSVPMQQLARVMVYAPDELTEEEKADIEMYMPDYMRYEPPGRRPGKRYLPGRTV